MRIQRSSNGEVVFSLSGRIQTDDLAELRRLFGLEEAGQGITLDLQDITLVDRDAVKFLAECQSESIRLKNCPGYIREWIEAEAAGKNAEQPRRRGPRGPINRREGRIVMFKSLVTSERHYNVAQPASVLAGIAGKGGVGAVAVRTSADESNTNQDPHGKERLAERTRIAQELHDTLLQGFFAVSMQLHTAVDYLPADSAAKPRFSSVLRTMERVLEEGRRAVCGLRSTQHTGPSLGQALASVPNELGFPSGAGFRVIVEGRQRELSAGLHDELYRIGREAIINAYRHSQAKEIETEIEYRSNELRIAVRDNGCGIDPQQLERVPNGHWGLKGMRERAERIGARLRILSKVALGTEVELRVPSQVAFEPSQLTATR